MKRVLSVENMRKSDAATISLGTSGIELMKRAGQGIFDCLSLRNFLDCEKIAIICGSGNNAGDGYVLALLLYEHNIPCDIYIIKERFSEDGKYYFDKCVDAGISYHIGADAIKELRSQANNLLLVDCILGTGFTGVPRADVEEVINLINGMRNEVSCKIASVDICSGLNGDSGRYITCVKADLTISIGDFMPGLFLGMAKDVTGELVNIDIGIEPVDNPYYLYEKSDTAKMLPPRKNNSNKGTYGYMALIGGSYKYSGAITLATMANAAMRSGSGVVMVAAPRTVCDFVIPKILESTVYPLSDNEGELIYNEEEIRNLADRVSVIACGMGIGKSDESKKLLEYLLGNYKGILIVDADGLNCMAEMPIEKIKNNSCRRLIVTPHPKEFSRIAAVDMAEVVNAPIDYAMDYAKKTGAIVLLKGATTVVTDGDRVYLVNRGCPGMATAGSGDVLSGILAAVCGYNKDSLLEATAAAAFINGYAGEIAQNSVGAISMIASDTVSCIVEAINKITGNN